MILITGGAGFIGSNLQAALFARGYETVVVDRIQCDDKSRNLSKHPPSILLAPSELEAFLATSPKIEWIVHLGAVNQSLKWTTENAWPINVELSKFLWDWCARKNVRFMYASSSATYGDGTYGFQDSIELSYLGQLTPLNPYGWTKHAFDLHVARTVANAGRRPPQWAGLKLFNVFGPNEYHKRGMVSLVNALHNDIRIGHAPRLYHSDRPDIADGAHQRDFIFIDDVVAVMLWLMERPSVNGLFNLGTGQSRCLRDVAHAVCVAARVQQQIAFVDMPQSLRGKYTSYTKAEMWRLRAAGYEAPFTSLEEGIRCYIQNFLEKDDPHK